MRAPALCHTLSCLKSSQTAETQSGCWCTSKITELFLIDFPGLVQLDHRFCSGCTRGGEMLGEIPQMKSRGEHLSACEVQGESDRADLRRAQGELDRFQCLGQRHRQHTDT